MSVALVVDELSKVREGKVRSTDEGSVRIEYVDVDDRLGKPGANEADAKN